MERTTTNIWKSLLQRRMCTNIPSSNGLVKHRTIQEVNSSSLQHHELLQTSAAEPIHILSWTSWTNCNKVSECDQYPLSDVFGKKLLFIRMKHHNSIYYPISANHQVPCKHLHFISYSGCVKYLSTYEMRLSEMRLKSVKFRIQFSDWLCRSFAKLPLTGGNWQKWKRVFLTCPCHEIYRDEAVV